VPELRAALHSRYTVEEKLRQAVEELQGDTIRFSLSSG
jgi:hypothetical protein